MHGHENKKDGASQTEPAGSECSITGLAGAAHRQATEKSGTAELRKESEDDGRGDEGGAGGTPEAHGVAAVLAAMSGIKIGRAFV